MAWKVGFTSKAKKQARSLAPRERDLLARLVYDLAARGAILPDWPNYSKLTGNQYHCHLNYRWVACWTLEDDRLKLIEIYYVRSRGSAPY